MDAAEFSIHLVKNSLIDKPDARFHAIMGWREVDVFRQPLSFLFPADAHDRVDRLLEGASGVLDNIIFPHVPLRVKKGGYINFDMRMLQIADGERRLDFFRPGGARNATENAGPPTDMYSFFNFVEELLNSPYDGDVGLTMVSVGALREDSALSETDKETARSEIVAGLQSKAIGGSLGVLDEASYGLVTAGDFDEYAFDEELKNVAIRLNLPVETFAANTANIEIDDRNLPSETLQQALGHARGIFLGEIEAEGELGKLSGVVDGIQHNRKLIEKALKRFHYRTSPRLISDAIADVSIAQLQQGKVNLEGHIRSPNELIVMADHPDISLLHDMAQLEDLVRMRVRRAEHERKKPDFYELCRSTLIQEAFFGGVGDILNKHGEEACHLGFRVQGMPPIKRGGLHWDCLNRLAELGHPIWIDRFGDAVIAPEAFKRLEGGYIELQAGMMRKLSGHFDGKDLMAKLIATWNQMHIGVLALDLPDYKMKTLAHELGIHIVVEDAPEHKTEQ